MDIFFKVSDFSLIFKITIADKTVQTDCFCQCYATRDADIKNVLDVVAKMAEEIKDLKMNVTGKTAAKLMNGVFPIKSDVELAKIHYNLDSTENFEFRLVNKV